MMCPQGWKLTPGPKAARRVNSGQSRDEHHCGSPFHYNRVLATFVLPFTPHSHTHTHLTPHTLSLITGTFPWGGSPNGSSAREVDMSLAVMLHPHPHLHLQHRQPPPCHISRPLVSMFTFSQKEGKGNLASVLTMISNSFDSRVCFLLEETKCCRVPMSLTRACLRLSVCTTFSPVTNISCPLCVALECDNSCDCLSLPLGLSSLLVAARNRPKNVAQVERRRRRHRRATFTLACRNFGRCFTSVATAAFCLMDFRCKFAHMSLVLGNFSCVSKRRRCLRFACNKITVSVLSCFVVVSYHKHHSNTYQATKNVIFGFCIHILVYLLPYPFVAIVLHT